MGQLLTMGPINSIFGFLAGSVTAGAGMYYYVMEEYKVANQLLSEDIYVRVPFTTLCLRFHTLRESRIPLEARFVCGHPASDEDLGYHII